MSSNIIYTSIDETFPVAGQDNNSQGFRDNFNIIKGALGVAKEEITELQTNSVLVSTLGPTNDPVDNDLQGSTLNNGAYSNLHSAANVRAGPTNDPVDNRAGVTLSQALTVYDINFNAEPFHVFVLNTSTNDIDARLVEFQFKNFFDPDTFDNVCSRVLVQIYNNGNYSLKIANFSVPNGTYVPESNVAANLTIAAKHYKLYEAWTYDKGIHLFLRYIGDFYAPVS